jgi:hypothetical protein
MRHCTNDKSRNIRNVQGLSGCCRLERNSLWWEGGVNLGVQLLNTRGCYRRDFYISANECLMILISVECIRHPPTFFAKRLHDALNRMNVDDDTLIRCIVGRSEVTLLHNQACQILRF